jgi:hypothetical protein
LERCLSSGAWRAADLWAAAAAAGARRTLLLLSEREAALAAPDCRAAAAAERTDGGGRGCRLRDLVRLMATLAGAADWIASDILGPSEVEALRMLEALSGLHAACAFHDDTRDAVVRLAAAFCGCGRLAALLGEGGPRGARARALVLRVLHGTLKRWAWPLGS